MLICDAGWAVEGLEGGRCGGGERSGGNGSRVSSSTIEYGRSRAVQLASPGLTLNRAEDRATQLPFHAIPVRSSRATEPVDIDTLNQLQADRRIAGKFTIELAEVWVAPDG